MNELDKLIPVLGVPVIVVILLLREILPYFTKGRDSNTNGNGGIKRAEFDDFKKAVQYKDTCRVVHDGILDKFHNVEEYNTQRREYLNDEFKKINVRFDKLENLITNGHK